MALSHRTSGVLLPIFSLPGKYGIGTFGQEARNFIDQIKKMGFTYWQILPLCPVDDHYSPYKSTSAFAGNPLFIDPEFLFQNELITGEELNSAICHSPYQVDYSFLKQTRYSLFQKAFSRIPSSLQEKIDQFAEKEAFWLNDYCLYMVLAEKFNNSNWSSWPDPELICHNSTALQRVCQDFANDINFHTFLQFVFYEQWVSLKSYAHSNHIQIIGDMPIYVDYESSDVWGNPQYFQLDEQFKPEKIAGVPPDYFSSDGQLWGNPLYNWTALQSDDYSWWFNRLTHALETYDLVRIDHFRAFSAYWSVPADANSAVNGHWVKGPGINFFIEFAQKHDSSRIIAEDLGIQDNDLSQLLEETGFPGMRIMSFAFLDSDNNIHLPHNYHENTIAYTGTHDNNTLLGSLFNYTPEQRSLALSYCQYQELYPNDWQEGGFYSRSCRSLIATLFKSHANLVILPIQDLCGYGQDTVINQPGTVGRNWKFRIPEEALFSIDANYFSHLNHLYQRCPK